MSTVLSEFHKNFASADQLQRQEQLIRKLTADLKKEKEDDEKKRSDQQAVVWQTEKEQFDEFMADRNDKKKATMDQYRNELKDQMHNREEKEREMASLSRLTLP